MGEPTASLASGYLAIQADLDRDCFFAFWNEDEYGVGYASGPFSGIVVGDIEMGASPQPGGGEKYVQRKEGLLMILRTEGSDHHPLEKEG